MLNYGGVLWIVPLVVAWAFAASMTFRNAFNLALIYWPSRARERASQEAIASASVFALLTVLISSQRW